MKIVVDAESLVSGVQFVTRSFDTKNDKAFIALVINDGEGYLSHENPVSLMKAPVEISSISFEKGEDEKEVKLALNGAFVQKLASVLSGVKGEVTLSKSLNNKGALHVTAPTGKFTIPVFDSRIPALKDFDSLGYVDNYRYFDSLARLSKICDTKHASTLPMLSSITVTFDTEEETATMMATDRYSMGEVIPDFDPVDNEEWLLENPSIFIPVEFATLLSGSKDGGAINLVREPDSKKFGYSYDDGRVALFSLKDIGKAWAYEDQKRQVLENIDNSFLASMMGLKKAINSVSMLTWDENEIYLNIKADGVSVTDKHEQNVVNVPVEGISLASEDPIRITFVRSVLNNSLSPITSDDVFFGIQNESLPASFRNVDEGEPTDDTFVLAVPVVDKG